MNKKIVTALMPYMMAMVAAESEIFNGDDGRNKKAWDEVSGEKFNVCPKGCKQYFFNINGEFSTEKMLRSECVFTCFAINDKSAIRKFKQHNKNRINENLL